MEHYIKQKVDGIVMLSIHSLPNDRARADEILHMAIDNKVQLHFANEFCVLKTKEDLERIQTYLCFSPDKERTYDLTTTMRV